MGHFHRIPVVLAILGWLAAVTGAVEAAPGTQWRPMGREAVLRDAPNDAAPVVAPLGPEARLVELEGSVREIEGDVESLIDEIRVSIREAETFLQSMGETA